MEINHQKMEVNAGNNSIQIQIGKIQIINISKENVFEGIKNFSNHVFEISKEHLPQDAYEISKSRIDKLTDCLTLRLKSEKNKEAEDIIKVFNNPAFQKSYIEAQLIAAVTDREKDYELLAGLLVNCIGCNLSNLTNDRKIYNITAINHAIRVVNEVPEDALLALTASFNIKNSYFNNLLGDFDKLDNIFRCLPLAYLPTDVTWIEHLQQLGLIKQNYRSSNGKMNLRDTFAEQIFKEHSTLSNEGILKKSPLYQNICEKIKALEIENFQCKIFVDHELHPGYIRVNVINKVGIDTLIKYISSIENKKNIKDFLYDIYEDYSKEYPRDFESIYEIDDDIRENFNRELGKRKYLAKVVEWWDDISIRMYPFDITSSGVQLAGINQLLLKVSNYKKTGIWI